MNGRSHAARISAVVDSSKMTYVDVDTDVYDERNSGSGCSPNVSAPYNTLEESMSKCRWSCKRDILDSSDEDHGWCVMYYFEDPQDIVDLQIAFDQGYKIP